MRSPRTLVLSVLAPVAILSLVAGCGDDSTNDGTKPAGTDTAGTTADTAAPASDPAGTGPAASQPVTSDAPTNPDKPEVSLPKELPTELVITDLTTGTGPAAAAGDTVVVNYVGVRSEDGTEFDNSYDRGSPFPVTLGQNSVIQGWEQGLLGVQQGGRRQLDIPADLAYGDAPQGDVIKAGDALTFVIDVVAVIPATDPADAPEITVEGGPNVTDVTIDELVAGSGPAIAADQTAVMHLIAYRADTGEQLASTWEDGAPQSIQFTEGATLPGLYTAMNGVQVGTRRQVQVPFLDAWGAEGNDSFGLPAETDVVIVFDVIAIY